jgi:hypothetical protein
MSSIIYYSNFCKNCQSLIKSISTSKIKDDIHFLCIDNRKTGNNGAVYIILENGQEIILPPNVSRVPAMMLLKKSNQVIFGKDIINYLKPKQDYVVNTKTNDLEPDSFSINNNQFSGITSDAYSFLNQDNESMSAKGNGGLRQMHFYASLEYNDKIETPAEDYIPDKIGNISMEKLQQQRNKDLNIN